MTMKSTIKGEVNHLWGKSITVSILRTQTADQEADAQGSMSKISLGNLLQSVLVDVQNRS